MRIKRCRLIGVLLLVLVTCAAQASQQAPPPPVAQAKCPVCGMFVAKYPDWTGAVTLKDGVTVYFDGPKDLFAYCFDIKKYDSARNPSDIAAVYVKDYYTLSFIDGRKAFYVIGSDVLGPMGKELIPFATKGDADGFLSDHHGKKVLLFGEITPEVIQSVE